MSLNEETYTLDEWKMIEKGIKIPRKKPIPRPEPEPPEIPNLLKFSDLEIDKVKRIVAIGQAERKRNKDGINFIFYKVGLELENGKILEGYMNEGDALSLKRIDWIRTNTDARVLNVIS